MYQQVYSLSAAKHKKIEQGYSLRRIVSDKPNNALVPRYQYRKSYEYKKAIKLVDKTLVGRKVISTTIHGKSEECEMILEHKFLAIKNEKGEVTRLTRNDRLLANEEEYCIIPSPA